MARLNAIEFDSRAEELAHSEVGYCVATRKTIFPVGRWIKAHYEHSNNPLSPEILLNLAKVHMFVLFEDKQ